MRILVTNDDGITSPHLQALALKLRHAHDVWVFAPAKEQSASSHSITLGGPLIVEEKGEKQFTCSGTPADCVLLALHGYIDADFDLVISGINMGANLGTDIIYSGTAAGARQGAIMGKPSIAVSTFNRDPDEDISYQVDFIYHNIDILSSLWKPDHFININFPDKCTHDARVEFTFPSKRVYNDTLTRFSAPDGKTYCFFKGDIVSPKKKGSDYYVVESRNISVSLITTQPAHNDIQVDVQAFSFWKGENE
jgi:5'-nucleotidase